MDPMFCVTVGKHAALVGIPNGGIKLLAMSHVSFKTKTDFSDDTPSTRIINLNTNSNVVSISYSGDFKYIIAGTADGCIFKILINGCDAPYSTEIEVMRNDVSVAAVSRFYT